MRLGVVAFKSPGKRQRTRLASERKLVDDAHEPVL